MYELFIHSGQLSSSYILSTQGFKPNWTILNYAYAFRVIVPLNGLMTLWVKGAMDV